MRDTRAIRDTELHLSNIWTRVVRGALGVFSAPMDLEHLGSLDLSRRR